MTWRGAALLLAASALAAGCIAPPAGEEAVFAARPCPPHDAICVGQHADAYVAFRMGADASMLERQRVERAEVPDFCREPGACGFDAPRWHVVYALRTPDAPWAEGLPKEVVLSEDATRVERAELPPCAWVPRECALRVDGAEARAIARAAGLGGDPAAWGATFTDNARHGFVWAVRNATSGSVDRVGHGDALIIDANDGRLLERRVWHAMP